MHGGEAHDFGAESEDGEWWTHLEDGWMDPDMHDPKEGTCQASII